MSKKPQSPIYNQSSPDQTLFDTVPLSTPFLNSERDLERLRLGDPVKQLVTLLNQAYDCLGGRDSAAIFDRFLEFCIGALKVIPLEKSYTAILALADPTTIGIDQQALAVAEYMKTRRYWNDEVIAGLNVQTIGLFAQGLALLHYHAQLHLGKVRPTPLTDTDDTSIVDHSRSQRQRRSPASNLTPTVAPDADLQTEAEAEAEPTTIPTVAAVNAGDSGGAESEPAEDVRGGGGTGIKHGKLNRTRPSRMSTPDLLGEFYMTWGSSHSDQKWNGQFFTPWDIALLLAQLLLLNIEEWPTDKVVSIGEPCCGSGVMMLAVYEVLRQRRPDLVVNGLVQVELVDVDYTCVLMAEVNLRLYQIPFWRLDTAPTTGQTVYTQLVSLIHGDVLTLNYLDKAYQASAVAKQTQHIEARQSVVPNYKPRQKETL